MIVPSARFTKTELITTNKYSGNCERLTIRFAPNINFESKSTAKDEMIPVIILALAQPKSSLKEDIGVTESLLKVRILRIRSKC